MGLEKLNPFRTTYHGGGAYQGRTGAQARAQQQAAEQAAALAEINGCRKCVRSKEAFQLCRKHKKPKYVKAAAKGM